MYIEGGGEIHPSFPPPLRKYDAVVRLNNVNYTESAKIQQFHFNGGKTI